MTKNNLKDENDIAGGSTFCVNPFLEVNVTPSGSVKPCCAWPEMTQNGRPMTVYEHSIEEIWNSEAMRSVRRKLTNGQQVKECSYCYNQEKTGARSMRIDGTRAWEAGWLNPEGETIEGMKARARANDFRLPGGPEWIDLDVGNLCNLKCRMCNSLSSSRIAEDPVHSRWTWDFETPARWQGLAMVVAPKRVLGVAYEGISRLDQLVSPPVAWLEGAGTISMKMAANEIFSVQVTLRSADAQRSPLEIFINDISVYRGELSSAVLTQKIELPTQAMEADKLVVRIESLARVGIEELKLLRATKGKSTVAFSRFSSGKQWFQDKEFLCNDLLYKVHDIVKMNFIGGEPLLIKEVRSIMNQLVSLGVAKDITLCMTTNGTIADDEWCDLAAQFKTVVIAVSLDGFAAVNDYIRYPSKWDSIEPNIRRLQHVPGAYVYVNMTVQAYNMLHVPALAQYCEEMDLDLRYHFLENPKHLSCLVMPQEARVAAAQRMRNFAMANAPDTTPRVHRTMNIRQTMLDLATILEANDKPLDPKLLNDFMVFTNDLDADREQNFASVNSELKDLIAAYGVSWNSEASKVCPAERAETSDRGGLWGRESG
jgi:glutamate-1-semialdehyde 2,1-aminomutase